MPASSSSELELSELEELEDDEETEDEDEEFDDRAPDPARLPVRPASPAALPRRARGSSTSNCSSLAFAALRDVTSSSSFLFWAAFSRALRLLAATSPSSSDDDELDPEEEFDRLGRCRFLRPLAEADEEKDVDDEPLCLR